jgi:hypothetical protein
MDGVLLMKCLAKTNNVISNGNDFVEVVTGTTKMSGENDGEKKQQKD